MLLRVLACACVVACSSPPRRDRYPDLPVEQDPRDAGPPEDAEELPYVPLASDPTAELPTPPPREPLNPSGKPAGSIPATACISAGTYQVRVDLADAKLSQVNTGMTDLRWCRSLLEGVPATTMAVMKIAVAAGQMTVEWPPGNPSTIVALGPCSFAVTSPPMIAQLTFGKGGKAAGTTSYAVGTPNHPDESCSAVGAKLFLERAGP